MYSELFVAQHHGQPAPGTAGARTRIGYFTSFDEASRALDETFSPGCWQGILRDATHERWWRDGTVTWTGPHRTRRRSTT